MPIKPFVNPVHIAAQAYAGRTERPGVPAARGQVPAQTQRGDQAQGAAQAQAQSQGLRHSTSGVQVEISAAALEAAKRQQVRLHGDQPRQAAEAREAREAREASETRKAERAERAEEARFEASREAGRREAPFAHLRGETPAPRSKLGALLDITV
ncbi:hypothetical protein [Tepidicaulis marinus]|uniref:hypothetical protein n=1 Tax=Tepidicaulis marinus TaxID=1333998 RepID=UPI0012E0ADB9|nr:hypothetical protein [Tepidicaulis marinus]